MKLCFRQKLRAYVELHKHQFQPDLAHKHNFAAGAFGDYVASVIRYCETRDLQVKALSTVHRRTKVFFRTNVTSKCCSVVLKFQLQTK